MPLHLQPLDVSADLDGVHSALIVSCPVCPPVSLAIQKGSPLIELFRRGISTGAFKDHVAQLRDSLGQRGIRTGVLTIYAPLPTMCLWTRRQRNRLRRRAKDHDAVLVLGCESAALSARQALEITDCRVILAMRTTGITNATVKVRFPMTVTLEEKALVGECEGSE